ncbi:MAG: TraR/DksA family transcriptional regulator [Thermoguttaceae bacterium]
MYEKATKELDFLPTSAQEEIRTYFLGVCLNVHRFAEEVCSDTRESPQKSTQSKGLVLGLVPQSLIKQRLTLCRRMELGSGNFDQELTLSLLGSERNALDQIETAITRIENGSYGRCETCGVNIPNARLKAIPYAALCVRCASEQENVLTTLAFRESSQHRVLPPTPIEKPL